MSRRVVVTGGSCISSLGMELDEIFTSLKSLKNRIVRMEDWDKYTQMNTRLAAPILYDLPEYPRKKIRGAGRVGLLALASADKAMQVAGLTGDTELLKSGRVGVAYGSSMGSVNPLMDFFSMLNPPYDCSKITATTYIRSMPQTCAVNISVFFGMTGRLITTNTACTSGSLSIGYAYEAIKYGMQDVMVAGGADELDPTESAVFDTLFATSVKNDTPELTPAAYDKDRDGLVIGEGAGTLVLEEYEHAKARGAHIYAELVGFGHNTDGDHITQPKKETMQHALELALLDSGVAPEAIGYVNGHGTATHHGDIAESWATYGAFRNRAVPLSSLKSYIGHSLGACGGIEAWLGINMMNRGWFSPNLNLKNVDPECAPLDYITGSGREMDVEYFMSNNFAFGGINTSLIFKKV
ncbi:3-oxoacyl-[acyl-carrier-protein] synthase II [Fibrobacter sp. UWH9]|uniref:beta-ketoacyl-ACP synthase n=1 Tax=unclassified Fibrobacter TaxID=2634177 RepID=UPI000921C60C|nr:MULTISPECIES: beta-ketoacyl-ACP synthase [Fibrobacter]MCQ2098972.1 beta-ketoacyl-ACP synthase [Fibrobacter sp.]MCL4100870.1 3-oxoacyl-[acyl-carrier-protein] synthase 2 [Fibrobacter succinogenes]MDO4947660.1 beta-ketoacyl-ACP synthase [Fibrobacter sp.]OWV08124.1 beta-ketoacyl-ACP synthase II [Fibrobacter sp. UWH3]OWV15339.1 beta-ketoacyl-ACP synthase II [Fibrobacter sp. UWH1]